MIRTRTTTQQTTNSAPTYQCTQKKTKKTTKKTTPLSSTNHSLLPPPPRTTTSSSSSSPIKRPPHKRHRPSSSSTTAATATPPHDPNLVLLDIGGTTFKTSRSTLLAIPNTYFTAHLTFAQQHTTTHHLFIDRDSAHFRHILNYMRDRSLPDGLTACELNELWREVQYYAIDELRERIEERREEMRREEVERRRETERLLVHASASERQQQMWPNRSLSNPLQSAGMAAAAATAGSMGVHSVQRAVSTAAADLSARRRLLMAV